MSHPPEPGSERAPLPARLVRWLNAGWVGLAGEPLLLILLVAGIALQIAAPQPASVLLMRIDWPTLASLAGLLMLTQVFESSGFLNWLARRMVMHVRTERTLALLLIAFAALLSMWLTNDVALFVVIPLLASLHALAPLPFKRLVIFSALAVNAGSLATPLGNPQNLFLWQSSGISFAHFVRVFGPLALALCVPLLMLCACAFRGCRLSLPEHSAEARPDWGRAAAAAVLFIGFVWLADQHHAGMALLLVVLCLLWLERAAVLGVDVPLLLIFALMFVVLRGAATLPWVHDAIAQLRFDAPLHVYLAGALLSQGVSNVPATILLSSFTHDWRALGYGVSVGGFGCAIGSLANLIAVRLAKTRGLWMPFHLVSIPFGLVSLLIGALMLRLT